MMGRSFRIGRIYGINIKVEWSWSLIVLLITWNLTSALGQLHEEWGLGLRLGIALLASLLFFASVLAHELGHALVARAQGLPVRNITLFFLGGVANIQREPESAKDEFWMALAGPLVSLLLGALMLSTALLSLSSTGGLGAPGVINRLSPSAIILVWLGAVNLILALFNLIPGFPLDGGRVLRSILWGITHNVRTATRWVAAIGQVIAWVMMVAGVGMVFGVRIPFFGTGLVSGIWLAFIGWFLNSASGQSAQQVAIQNSLDGIPVARLMRIDPPTIGPNCTVNDLVHLQGLNKEDQAFPVIQDSQLLGLVTLEDIRKVPKENWLTTSVASMMTPGNRLVTVHPEEDAAEAMEKLINRDVRQLPVVRKSGAQGSGTLGSGEFLGLLRRHDIMHWLQLNSDSAQKT